MPDINALNAVYNRWDRFLNTVSKSVGGDRELDELSNKLNDIKQEAYRDGVLTPQEMDAIYARVEVVTKAYAQVAATRGYPIGKTLPTTKEAFKVYGENQEIHFQTLAGNVG